MAINFFCINLPTRQDRWINCEKQFKKQKIEVKRWNATPLPENRRFGAWLSHREIIEHAQKNKWDYVWVFEDDVVFMRDKFIDFVDESLKTLKGKKWYILYFWWLVCRNGKLQKEKWFKWLFRVKWLMWTHAVIYNKEVYDIYLKLHPDKYSNRIKQLYINNQYKALDEWMALDFQNNFPCYITEFFLAGQWDSFSNIEGKMIKGNLRAIIRFNIYKYWFGWLAKIGGEVKNTLKTYLPGERKNIF